MGTNTMAMDSGSMGRPSPASSNYLAAQAHPEHTPWPSHPPTVALLQAVLA